MSRLDDAADALAALLEQSTVEDTQRTARSWRRTKKEEQRFLEEQKWAALEEERLFQERRREAEAEAAWKREQGRFRTPSSAGADAKRPRYAKKLSGNGNSHHRQDTNQTRDEQFDAVASGSSSSSLSPPRGGATSTRRGNTVNAAAGNTNGASPDLPPLSPSVGDRKEGGGGEDEHLTVSASSSASPPRAASRSTQRGEVSSNDNNNNFETQPNVQSRQEFAEGSTSSTTTTAADLRSPTSPLRSSTPREDLIQQLEVENAELRATLKDRDETIATLHAELELLRAKSSHPSKDDAPTDELTEPEIISVERTEQQTKREVEEDDDLDQNNDHTDADGQEEGHDDEHQQHDDDDDDEDGEGAEEEEEEDLLEQLNARIAQQLGNMSPDEKP